MLAKMLSDFLNVPISLNVTPELRICTSANHVENVRNTILNS